MTEGVPKEDVESEKKEFWGVSFPCLGSVVQHSAWQAMSFQSS